MTSRIKHTFITLTGFAVLAGPVRAQYHEYDEWNESYTVQALLGAVQYERLKFDIEDSATAREIDNSVLPQLGGAWTTLPFGEYFQYGLEASFLLGFKFDKLNYLVLGGSGLRASISYRFWMFDLAGGAYINLFPDPGRKIRLYAGAGPLLVYADYRSDKEFDSDVPDEEQNESAFGMGVYARTGIEFRTQERGMLGLGVRGSWSNVDFSDIGGRNELGGIAAFATYTAGF